MSSNDDNELLDLAYPYALDAVSESERCSIVECLGAAAASTTAAFARIVADTRETLAIITALDALEPPPRLKTCILAALDEHTHPRDDLTARRAARRRRLARAVAATAAAAATGLGAAVATGHLSRHAAPPAGPTVAQVLAAPDIRTVTAEVAGGQVSITASALANAAVVTMTDVPPPPAGLVYQMWLIPAGGAPRSAGTMSVTTMPPPGGEVVGPLDAATTAAITVEPGTGSPQPTGLRIVTISLAPGPP